MDEYQILLEAKALITRQDYEAARRVLQPIAHNPTAALWLQKIDEIAPVPTEPSLMWDELDSLVDDPYTNLSDEEKFERVKALIQQKNYTEARKILLTLPDNPPAQKLLIRLGQIVPSMGNLTPADAPPPSGQLPKWSKRAWHPAFFAGFMFTFNPIALLLMSFNWRRLGKPKLFLPSLLGGFGLLAASVAMLIIPHKLGIDDDGALLVIVGLVFVFGMGYLFVVYGMFVWQGRVYQKYLKNPPSVLPKNLQYDFGWLGAIGVIFVLAVLWWLSSLSSGGIPREEAETEYLTVEYPLDWHTDPPNEAEYCQDYSHPQGCFLFLHRSIGSAHVAFVYIPLNGWTPGPLSNALWQQYLRRYPDVVVTGSQAEIVIDGTPILFHEFIFSKIIFRRFERYDNYVSRGYVTSGDGLIEITLQAGSESHFREVYPDFQDILDSIDLRSGTS